VDLGQLNCMSKAIQQVSSDFNFLYLQVCAPTGAGKTNIAMIAILHEVCIYDTLNFGVAAKLLIVSL